MAVIGWLLVTGFGVFFGVGGLLLLIVGSQFNGRFNAECLIPVVIGAALLYASYIDIPFTVSLVQ